MTAPESELEDKQVLAALTELARDSVPPPDPTQLRRGLEALSARLAGDGVSPARSRRWPLVTAMGAAAVAMTAGGLWLARARVEPAAPALAYRVEGGAVIEGGYLRETGLDGIRMRFDEGTELVFSPGTRGRLRAVDHLGARIALDQGTASFAIVRRDGAKWLVDAGPFLVAVKGTAFTASWDPGAERFELGLRHGQVTVSGPVAGGELALRAGQRLVVNLPQAETSITESLPGEATASAPDTVTRAATPPTEQPPAAADKPVPRPVSAGSGPGRTDGRRWAEALAAGELNRILAEVERAGVKSTLEQASSEDLYALAAAARYRKRVPLARAALLAERRRFPASSQALDAAFLLGRLDEDRPHGAAAALKWYDEYLSRAPKGTYASEALGRKMIVTNLLEGAARARPIADEYLRRFPAGTYAGSARALQRSP